MDSQHNPRNIPSESVSLQDIIPHHENDSFIDNDLVEPETPSPFKNTLYKDDIYSSDDGDNNRSSLRDDNLESLDHNLSSLQDSKGTGNLGTSCVDMQDIHSDYEGDPFDEKVDLSSLVEEYPKNEEHFEVKNDDFKADMDEEKYESNEEELNDVRDLAEYKDEEYEAQIRDVEPPEFDEEMNSNMDIEDVENLGELVVKELANTDISDTCADECLPEDIIDGIQSECFDNESEYSSNDSDDADSESEMPKDEETVEHSKTTKRKKRSAEDRKSSKNKKTKTDDNKSSSDSEDKNKEVKGGNLRKNIREVMDETKLEEATLAAQRQEVERLRRVQEQQKIIRDVQRQMAINKQNNKTQARVLSLLQGGTTTITRKTADVTETTPAVKTANTVLVKLSSGSEAPQVMNKQMIDMLKKQTTPSKTQEIELPTTNRFANLSTSMTKPHMINASVSIAPIKPADSKPNDLEKPKPPAQELAHVSSGDSDDDCIVISEPSEGEESEGEDVTNSGMHTNDSFNIPDDQGRVLVNVGHPKDDPDVFLAPQIARIIKPHQIGGVRFLFDNIVESVSQYKCSEGFGCILAHSMGLGKTLQIVSFSDVFLRYTDGKTILCIMPINTLQNWMAEFNMWLPPPDSELAKDPDITPRTFPIFVLNDNQKTLSARAVVVQNWHRQGGVLLIGYELYRQLSLKKPPKSRGKAAKRKTEEEEEVAEAKNKSLLSEMYEALVKPGPDLVICDEGHRIKNSHASISQALKQIRSKRRVVLTGYPLQNNLLEYWCMVDFVRPNYLGTKTEFSNMFERPIQNGQCIDSTPQDIRLMRHRAHVLHSLLEGFVQRRSHSVLQQTLPTKYEYVLLFHLTDFQRKLYNTFMNEVVRTKAVPNPLKAFAVCCKIWNHPDILYNFLKKRAGDEDRDLDIEETAPGLGPSTPLNTATPPPTPNSPAGRRPRGRPTRPTKDAPVKSRKVTKPLSLSVEDTPSPTLSTPVKVENKTSPSQVATPIPSYNQRSPNNTNSTDSGYTSRSTPSEVGFPSSYGSDFNLANSNNQTQNNASVMPQSNEYANHYYQQPFEGGQYYQNPAYGGPEGSYWPRNPSQSYEGGASNYFANGGADNQYSQSNYAGDPFQSNNLYGFDNVGLNQPVNPPAYKEENTPEEGEKFGLMGQYSNVASGSQYSANPQQIQEPFYNPPNVQMQVPRGPYINQFETQPNNAGYPRANNNLSQNHNYPNVGLDYSSDPLCFQSSAESLPAIRNIQPQDQGQSSSRRDMGFPRGPVPGLPGGMPNAPNNDAKNKSPCAVISDKITPKQDMGYPRSNAPGLPGGAQDYVANNAPHSQNIGPPTGHLPAPATPGFMNLLNDDWNTSGYPNTDEYLNMMPNSYPNAMYSHANPFSNPNQAGPDEYGMHSHGNPIFPPVPHDATLFGSQNYSDIPAFCNSENNMLNLFDGNSSSEAQSQFVDTALESSRNTTAPGSMYGMRSNFPAVANSVVGAVDGIPARACPSEPFSEIDADYGLVAPKQDPKTTFPPSMPAMGFFNDSQNYDAGIPPYQIGAGNSQPYNFDQNFNDPVPRDSNMWNSFNANFDARPDETKVSLECEASQRDAQIPVESSQIKKVERIPPVNNSIAKKNEGASSESVLDNEVIEAKKQLAEMAAASTTRAKEEPIPYDWANDFFVGYEAGKIEASAKMAVFFCMLEEIILLGDRMLLFSQSLFTLNLIEEFLQMNCVPGKLEHWARNKNYYRLDGSTSALEREKLINEFNVNCDVHLFLVSTRAGSLGINLVGANRVIVFDASWNPCHDTQAVCRVYRYGQQKPCYVYRFVMDSCLEKKIYDRQINKQGMADRVVDECNPDAHLTIKDVTNLCYDNDEPNTATLPNLDQIKHKYADAVIRKVIEKYGHFLSKEPFQHESLLVDRKDKKLSQAEKRMAKRSYELEKQANTKNAMGIKTLGGIRPMFGAPNFQRDATRKWIPADVWKKQGMSAQEMTLPLDVVIPTNTADARSSIVLKAGQKVMVLKSHKGIYMQLENGKIIAIKTAPKGMQVPGNKPGVKNPSSVVRLPIRPGVGSMANMDNRRGMSPMGLRNRFPPPRMGNFPMGRPLLRGARPPFAGRTLPQLRNMMTNNALRKPLPGGPSVATTPLPKSQEDKNSANEESPKPHSAESQANNIPKEVENIFNQKTKQQISAMLMKKSPLAGVPTSNRFNNDVRSPPSKFAQPARYPQNNADLANRKNIDRGNLSILEALKARKSIGITPVRPMSGAGPSHSNLSHIRPGLRKTLASSDFKSTPISATAPSTTPEKLPSEKLDDGKLRGNLEGVGNRSMGTSLGESSGCDILNRQQNAKNIADSSSNLGRIPSQQYNQFYNQNARNNEPPANNSKPPPSS